MHKLFGTDEGEHEVGEGRGEVETRRRRGAASLVPSLQSLQLPGRWSARPLPGALTAPLTVLTKDTQAEAGGIEDTRKEDIAPGFYGDEARLDFQLSFDLSQHLRPPTFSLGYVRNFNFSYEDALFIQFVKFAEDLCA
ncbi:hypothetical protein AK812_SmicGene30738 [Symbiodinium microadriaticum]|uniref:Uncharacterized protein n=1 Tax=Symbiodinium microadriaticum TaxID=2951 RepID=A0A1Q9CYH4_SYMMI|nr:hypothetical protein AK812_SmicGene30738 [Symbiodinium microadriaticum]